MRYDGATVEPVRPDEMYEERAMRYFEQTECALVSMRKIFEDMQKAGIFERSIIVVHGDHGSKIGKYSALYRNLNKLTPLEYRAIFSTLFAIKLPGGEFHVDKRVLPLSTLIEEFSKTIQEYSVGNHVIPDFAGVLPDDRDKVDPYVYLTETHPLTRVDIDIFED